MNSKTLKLVSACVVMSLGSATALAQSSAPSTSMQSQATSQTDSPSSTRRSPDTSKMEKQTENGVTFVCGGVGVGEATQMKQMANDYDLMLTFATQRGNYLADVNVGIADTKGKSVLKVTCGAPILLVDISKPGTYKIIAKAGDKTLTRTATVGTKRRTQTIAMLWPHQMTGSDDIVPTTTETGR